MKRAAICLSGHLREFEEGYKNITEHVIAPNPHCSFDFFIDTWSDREWRSSPDKQINAGAPLSEVLAAVSGLYKPVEMHIEQPMQWDTSEFYQYIRPGDVKKQTKGEHILGMYYKIWRCDSMRQVFQRSRGFAYDMVIRHRTDIGFDGDLLLTDELFASLETNGDRKGKIYIAKNYNSEIEWCSDVSAFGHDKAMEYYSLMFLCIKKQADKHKIFRPEPLLYHHLNDAHWYDTVEMDPGWFVIRS